MNLFAKIFLGFWLSTAAIIASWLLASQYVDPFGSPFETSLEQPAPPGLGQGIEPEIGPRPPRPGQARPRRAIRGR